MARLDEMIGEKILVCSLVAFESSHATPRLYEVILHGVETGGIWIESEILNQAADRVAIEQFGRPISPRGVPIYFLPYSQIHYLTAWTTRLEQGKLGLDND